jgi:hypothetical protein
MPELEALSFDLPVYQETCIGNRAGVIDEHIKMEECPCDP